MTLFLFLRQAVSSPKKISYDNKGRIQYGCFDILEEGFFVKIDGALCFMNNTYGVSHGHKHKHMMLKRGGTPDDVFDSTRNESRTCYANAAATF